MTTHSSQQVAVSPAEFTWWVRFSNHTKHVSWSFSCKIWLIHSEYKNLRNSANFMLNQTWWTTHRWKRLAMRTWWWVVYLCSDSRCSSGELLASEWCTCVMIPGVPQVSCQRVSGVPVWWFQVYWGELSASEWCTCVVIPGVLRWAVSEWVVYLCSDSRCSSGELSASEWCTCMQW